MKWLVGTGRGISAADGRGVWVSPRMGLGVDTGDCSPRSRFSEYFMTRT